MNFKKLAIAGASAALLFGSAAGVFANDGLNIENKNTHVTNHVTTQANTGFNQVNGYRGCEPICDGFVYDGGGLIFTGNAGALSNVVNTVNTNRVDLCGCLGDLDNDGLNIENKNTHVTNNVLTQANTGFNQVNGYGGIYTGDAVAQSWITNVVNTNVLGF